MRARLEREHGTAANQILWRGQVPLLGDATYTNEAIFAIDRWLAVVEKDTRAGPARAEDPARQAGGRHRPLHQRRRRRTCPPATCDATVQALLDPRHRGGHAARPTTRSSASCKPLDRATTRRCMFTDAQWEQLEKTFPNGVCDYAKPGVDRVPTATWQTLPGGATAA